MLSSPGVTPATAFAWSSSLDDAAAPLPIAGADRAAALAHLSAVRRYLDVERPEHLRYKKQPVNGAMQTFCNVYAYDALSLSGAYIALVWWTQRARNALRRGEAVAASTKERTVTALKANALHDWFVVHAVDFGWRRVERIVDAQAHADDGELVVITARGAKNPEGKRGPGHIAWVVEALEATASSDESRFVPTISQAGSNNLAQSTAQGRWWTKRRYDDFAFWAHLGPRR